MDPRTKEIMKEVVKIKRFTSYGDELLILAKNQKQLLPLAGDWQNEQNLREDENIGIVGTVSVPPQIQMLHVEYCRLISLLYAYASFARVSNGEVLSSEEVQRMIELVKDKIYDWVSAEIEKSVLFRQLKMRSVEFYFVFGANWKLCVYIYKNS